MHRTLACVVVCLAAAAAIGAQIPRPIKRLPVPDSVPGLDRFLDNPPLTTTTEDAWLEAPPLDGYTPPAFEKLADLPRGREGGFVLRPGAFATELESYCLHMATRGPVKGDGYLNAPLKGVRAGVIRSILRNASRHPGIPQRDIQVLIWTLLARVEVDDMDAKLRATASQMLTPEEIRSVSDSPWDLLETTAGRRAVSKLPYPARRALNIERDVRNLVRRGNYDYEQIERLAMTPASVVRPDPERRQVPRGRWMHHPKGFFIRYLPSGYPRTRVEILVPEKYTYIRDDLGPILSVADAKGNWTETEYDDAIAPLTVPGEARLEGYAFKTIRVTRITPAGPERHESRDRGWTFVHTRTARRPAPMMMLLTPVAFRPFQGAIERFLGWKERYDDIKSETWDRYEYYRERSDRMRGEPGEEAIDDLMNNEHYQDGIDAAIAGDSGDHNEWLVEQQERQRDALRHAVVVIDTLPTTSTAEGPEYAPWDDVAVPAMSGSQRLGMSGRGR